MPNLDTWSEVQTNWGPFPILLVGNGASRAIWSKFRYDDIYTAAATSVPPQLTTREIVHFAGNRNFELVLSQLLVAEKVSRQAGFVSQAQYFRERYRKIQDALGSSIRGLHIPFGVIDGTGVLERVASALQGHDLVFTTNYDVLTYWAILRARERDGYNAFKDYFFTRDDDETVKFSLSDSQIWPDPGHDHVTGVLYLHGALHLVRTPEGETHKLCRQEGQYLLDRFGDEVLGGASPLVVTEGTSIDKIRSIDRSGYLTFALSQLTESRDNVAVFGHSLSTQDEHINNAIKWERGHQRTVAVALRPSDDEDRVGAEKNRIRAALDSRLNVVFFDSTTHPLGDTGLNLG